MARYVFKKLVRMFEQPFSRKYIPLQYQIMSIICKRQISISLQLPLGSQVLIHTEPHETFGDIKVRAMEELGIDHERLPSVFFGFFCVVKY